jgi:probable phosphoglycerate mutase
MSGEAALPRSLALTIVRHGETELNRRGLTIGSLDPGLTGEGRLAVARAAGILSRAGLGATALYTSPALRCRESAAILAPRLGHAPLVLGDLAERCWGAFEGRPRALRSRLPPSPASGVEPEPDFHARVRRAFAALGPRPVVVTHSGVFRALAAWLGLPPSALLPTAGIAVLRPVAGAWRLDFPDQPPDQT